MPAVAAPKPKLQGAERQVVIVEDEEAALRSDPEAIP